MTVVVLGSVKGAPGVTTAALALALTWPLRGGQRVLLVDADPAGADLAAGYLQGAVGPAGGIGAVAAARGDVTDAVLAATVSLDATGHRLLLTGPTPAAGGRPSSWSTIACLDGAEGGDGAWLVIVDVGRLPAGTRLDALAAAAVVLVTGSSLRAAASARAAVGTLTGALSEPLGGQAESWLLVVGERRPYSGDELAASIGLTALPGLAWDPRAAAVLSDGAPARGRFARTALMRSAAATARALAEQLTAAHDRTDTAEPTPARREVNGHATARGVRS